MGPVAISEVPGWPPLETAFHNWGAATENALSITECISDKGGIFRFGRLQNIRNVKIIFQSTVDHLISYYYAVHHVLRHKDFGGAGGNWNRRAKIVMPALLIECTFCFNAGEDRIQPSLSLLKTDDIKHWLACSEPKDLYKQHTGKFRGGLVYVPSF